MVGLVIYAYYADIGCDPLRSKLISSSNQVHCIFVLNFFDDYEEMHASRFVHGVKL